MVEDKDVEQLQTPLNTEEEELRSLQLCSVLKTSEDYFQTNMNGLVNNMALTSV